ncbi:MAG: biopolymer transporter ExbD [Deltaproteobacteria bacterium]|jgi:biopolymer transport protein TolR|nr:biopolymer transporter ExbD [Deltaproteobacteria bacterium]
MDRELFDGWDEVQPLSDINVTPFIDIMLVLLIIFMVTAPLMLGGVHLNLPKTGGEPMPRPESPIIVSLDAENRVFADHEEVPYDRRREVFQELARSSENGEVFVRGDGMVRYQMMMDLMAALGQAGFARVTLVTDIRSGGEAGTPGQADPAASGQPADLPAGQPSAPASGQPSAPPSGQPQALPSAQLSSQPQARPSGQPPAPAGPSLPQPAGPAPGSAF